MRRLLPLIALLIVAGCGGAGAESADPPAADGADTAVTSPPLADPGAGGTGIVWTPIEPRDDLVNPSVATPAALLADPDDPSAVLVHLWGGVQSCFGANATVVQQDDQVVRIRVQVGSVPGGGDRACIEIAEAQQLRLTLDAPVGDRRLVAVTT